MRKLAVALLLGMLGSANLLAQFATTGTTSLQVTVGTEAAIRIDTDPTSLTTTGTNFTNPFTGTTNLTYKIRTGKASGTGSITVAVAAFSPSGGPSVSGGNLKYACTVASPGTGCSGTVTAATTDTSVATFGANAHSSNSGTGGNSLSWTLDNNPDYETGSYSATATFTISST